MNLKSKYIIGFLFLFHFNSYAQNTIPMATTLHEKYWFYRDRLKYFTQPGEGLGKSIIVDIRNPWATRNLRVGDQTIDLGWYLAILSTEYNRLGNQSLENDQTLTELYYAIKAFERLDLCETYAPWYKEEAQKDGFFMRYDIQLMMEDNVFDYDYFNHGMILDEDEFGTRPPGLPTYVNDIYFDDISIMEQKRTAMSQDQAALMLMGLGFVSRCLPNGEITFYNTVLEENTSYNFVGSAITNINNIGDYIGNVDLENGDWFDLYELEDGNVMDNLYNLLVPGSFMFTDNDLHGYWTIFDPNGYVVRRGAWPYLFRWGFHRAIKELTNHDIQTNFTNDISLNGGIPIWEAYPVFQVGPEHNRVFSSVLAAIADSWNIGMLMNTDGRIFDLLDDQDQQYLYLLLYMFFNDTNSPYVNDGTGQYKGQENSEAVIEEILSTAPLCGPYQFRTNDGTDYIHFDFCDCDLPRMASDGWAAQNRFRNDRDEQNGENEQSVVGNYPGLDYMLLYNLYHYYRNWWYGSDYGYIPYRNMINSNIEQSYPYEDNGTNYGTIQNPANLRAFESLNYDGDVGNASNENGSLNLIAGHRIKLTAGFHVYQGSTFNAKIEEYNCYEITNSKSSFVDNNFIKPTDNHIGAMYQENSNIETKSKSNIDQNFSDINIYPNPANTVINISINNSTDLMVYKIYNQQGQILYESSLSKNSRINVSELSNGLYYIEAIDNNGIAFREKFIVKH